MKRLLITTALVALSVSSAVVAHAADLIVDEAPVAAAPAASDWGFYGKLYGGYVLENNLFYRDDDYDTDAGWLAGASVGVDPGIGGLSFELDAATGSVTYSGYDATLDGTTLMANAVFTADLDAFEVYAGAGVGGVWVSYDTDDGDGTEYDGDGGAAAYQVFAGAGFDVTENLTLFAEGRYQSAFEDVTINNNNDEDVPVEWNRAAVLVGLKISN